MTKKARRRRDQANNRQHPSQEIDADTAKIPILYGNERSDDCNGCRQRNKIYSDEKYSKYCQDLGCGTAISLQGFMLLPSRYSNSPVCWGAGASAAAASMALQLVTTSL